MMNIEDTIRKMIAEELDKRDQQNQLIPVSQFCKSHDLSRATVWRKERQGLLKVVRIGRKVFINPSQFAE